MSNRCIPSCVALAALSLTAFASADFMPEFAQYAGGVIVNHRTGVQTEDKGDGFTDKAGSVVYDNTTSATSLAFSSTEVLTRTYGDRCNTAGTGILDSFKFSIFNSGSSAGTLVSATVLLSFASFDAVSGTATALGSFSSTVTFSSPLGAGFYSTVTATDLSSLGINLSSTSLLVTQKITAKTGNASRTGVVSLTPVTVGSSPTSFYQSSPTVAAGFYTSASGAVDLIYQIGVVPVPAPGAAALVGLAGMITGRRRR